MTPEEHFWERTIRTESGCLEWTGQRLRGHGLLPYGMLWWKGKTRRAHRVAWEIVRGPIPPGMDVLHRCDNPPCVDVEGCLFLGTNQDNVDDKVAKGRHKLSGAQAREHGTYSRYVNEKCRCRPCKTAKARYERERQKTPCPCGGLKDAVAKECRDCYLSRGAFSRVAPLAAGVATVTWEVVG